MTQQSIDDCVEKFENFGRYLDGAIAAIDARVACNWLLEVLGDRIPNEPDRMKANTEAMPPAMAAIPPLAGPAEPVKRTKAG